MAYDNTSVIDFRAGEQDVLSASFTGVAPATATINAGSTFTLYDQLGNIVPGFNGVPVTGYDAGASITTGRVWYSLNSTGLVPGIYYAVFAYAFTGLDTLVRNNKPDLQIRVLPVVEVVASYDVKTLRGIVRLQSRDTDCLNIINSDAEVDAMILMTGTTADPNGPWAGGVVPIGTVYLAASYCVNLMAIDAAKVAIIEKIGAISDNTKVTYDALKDMAASLMSNASQNVLPGVGGTTTIYIDGVAVTSPSDPFYNSPWRPMQNYGNGVTRPSNPLDTW